MLDSMSPGKKKMGGSWGDGHCLSLDFQIHKMLFFYNDFGKKVKSVDSPDLY